MPLIQLDVKMLPMKVHYFLFMGGVAPMLSFLPTIGKQLGYSTIVVGTIYCILPILSLITKPIVGVIVDQLRVKKTLFLTFILITALTSFSLMFVPEIRLESTTELNCHDMTFLNVCPKDKSMSKCDIERFHKLISTKSEDLITCELRCLNSEHLSEEMCKTWKFNDYCRNLPNSSNDNVNSFKSHDLQNIIPKSKKSYYNDEHIYLSAEIEMNHHTVEIEDKCFYFPIKSAKFYFNNSESLNHTPVCDTIVRSQCNVECYSVVIMDLITSQSYKGSVLELSQFWIFVLIVCLFWMSQAAIYSLSDSICFDLLGDKPNLYGKQRCWGAIGWGIFAIFSGWLVDLFSSSQVNKNYMPIHYLCLLVLFLNFCIASKLKVSETKISTNVFKDIRKLLVEVKVLGFLTWTVVFGMCTAMIWHYLFWYIEDVASMYECNSQVWIKTLQGFAMGVQCFGGEVPLFFWSGWIIKRLGHLNCMSLVLGVFAFRFLAYSFLTNPIWVLIIELTNGITFGLAYAVLMSYASVIALPGTESTMIGLVGGVFEGLGMSMGSLLGGHLYNDFGGAQTFRIFAYATALACVIHLLCHKFLKKSGKLGMPSYDFEEVQCNKSHFKESGFISGSTEYASPNEAIHMLSDA